MEVKIGNHIFGNNEMVESMLKTGMARLYDLSPGSREAHDDEAIFLNGKKIKSTPEERKAYWKKILSQPMKVETEIQPGEEVPNPWR